MTERLQTSEVNKRAEMAQHVFGKIDFCLQNMRESGLGIRDPDEKLTPQDIFIPTVSLKHELKDRTAQILQAVGLSDGFAVILVGNKTSDLAGIIVNIWGTEYATHDIWSSERKLVRKFHLCLDKSPGRNSFEPIVSLEHKIGSSDPSVFYVEEEKGQWASRTTVGLGASATDKTERVLLLVMGAGNRIQTTSVALPLGWKEGVEAGRLFGANTLMVETQTAQAAAVPETPKPESEAQKLQREMDGSPEQAFTKIKQIVEAFPESNLKGVIARKEGLRVATLDEKGALAEMRVLGHAIVFRLSGLDREKLKICLKSGFLSTGDLLSCFKADTANPDNLIIRAYLDLGRLKIFEDMQRYDVGKGKLASSLPYLDLNPEELAVLKKVMGDSLTLVTLLTKLSHPPEKEISGDLHDDPNFYRRHQRRNYLSLSSGNSFPSDEPRVSPVEQKLNKVRSELEIKDSATGSAPVRRDTPDNKKKYWAQKGKKNTPKKHK